MRARTLIVLFIFGTLAWGVPAHATVLDSQLDDSGQATSSLVSYVHTGGGIMEPLFGFLSIGYVPTNDITVSGVRFRVNTSGGGDYICPTGSVFKYSGVNPPAAWNSGPSVGILNPVATTTPGINGNCDYSLEDAYGRGQPVPFITSNYYVFFVNVDGYHAHKWVSMSGKPFSSSTPQSLFGYRHPFSYFYTWGTTGLDSAYLELFDTIPQAPITSPTITLLGSATTTVEFGSAFTDPGATATDEVDGDLTSAIQVTGSVDTNMIGTTTLAYSVTNTHGLSATTTREVVVACTHDCVSNVLFLPGIEGSRLYEGAGCGKATEEKLWEPLADSFVGILRGAGDDKVGDLAQDASGASVCSDIYVKEGDIIDTVRGSNIYASLVSEMDALLTDGTIADWKPVAYDWRLSLEDLLLKGTQHGEKIYYEEASSTPYIEQTLRALASSSKTGKVSVVTHSNGGLVAKALLNRLGSEASKSLVDKVVMVGVPQSGAPSGIGSMLVGYNAGIYKYGFPIVSNAAARAFTQNSPMAYHLLPSERYFGSAAIDVAHPVVRFSGNAYTEEVAAYGSTITNTTELSGFLLAQEGGREKPSASDLSGAEILNSALLGYANSTHATLDAWTPPEGIEVSQIAGWGVETVGGVDFYSAVPAIAGPATAVDGSGLDVEKKYKPILIEDGDGTVPVPSALLMAEGAEVKRYWIDLEKFNREQLTDREHKDLFEIPQLQDFIKDILRSSTSTLPAYISAAQPAAQEPAKRLTFFLHSPLTLELTDTSGNVTGLAPDGSVAEGIPGSVYGEFGEVKYVSVPQGSTYELTMHGQAAGTFSLDIQESSGGTVTNSSTIANVPTTESTLVSLTLSDGIDTASPLTVDTSGDGSDTFTITPVVGETVVYEQLVPQAASTVQIGGGAGGGDSTPVTVTQTVSEREAEVVIEAAVVATSTQLVATTTLPAAVVTTPVATTTALAVSPARPLAVAPREAKSQLAAVTNTFPNFSQTASVYGASQQQPIKRLGAVVYNKLHGFLSALGRLFRSK